MREEASSPQDFPSGRRASRVEVAAPQKEGAQDQGNKGPPAQYTNRSEIIVTQKTFLPKTALSRNR
jgi:hypothetical protein